MKAAENSTNFLQFDTFRSNIQEECNVPWSVLSEGSQIHLPHLIPSISQNMELKSLWAKNKRKSTLTSKDMQSEVIECSGDDKYQSWSPCKKKTLKDDISTLLKIMVKQKKRIGLKEAKAKSNSWVLQQLNIIDEFSNDKREVETKYITMKEIQSIPEHQEEE